LWSSNAHGAERYVRQGSAEVRISDAPCMYAGVLQHIQEAERPQFRKASGRFDGQSFFACWVQQRDQIFLVYEDGDLGVVPVKQFKDVPSA
ncbi:MAG: hypothetical protein ACTS8S_23525, partial [Giesbergeria sp.]